MIVPRATISVVPRHALHPLVNGVELDDATARPRWTYTDLPLPVRQWLDHVRAYAPHDIAVIVTNAGPPMVRSIAERDFDPLYGQGTCRACRPENGR